MNRQKLTSQLKIQSEFGCDWAFSEERNVLSDLEKIKQTTGVAKIEAAKDFSDKPVRANNTNPDSSFENSRIAQMPKQNKLSEAPAPSFSNGSKSTEEWIKLSSELANNAKTLEELKETVKNFEGLSIKKTATNTVFAEGNPQAKIMFIGEAPGENEDLKGVPFCGVSGRLLDEMIKHIGFTRSGNNATNSFYITNSIFWRPPGNRKPTPEEIAICKPFVEKHIALLQPKVIVLVGATATVSVLGDKGSISVLRNNMQKYYCPHNKVEIATFAIYHPSFLLRQPSQKKNTWFDLLKIKKYFETN